MNKKASLFSDFFFICINHKSDTIRQLKTPIVLVLKSNTSSKIWSSHFFQNSVASVRNPI